MTSDQKLILAEMERIALFMDSNFITVCGYGFGADSVIGLIPGVGDIGTTGVSLWIFIRIVFAFDKRLWRRKWCTMLMNIGIDFMFGMIPLAGDIFDVFWKSNIKNINILRKHYGMEPLEEAQASDEEEEEDEEAGKKNKSRWSKK
eukprot:CAMPEP_0194034964 /NCGR_PEP_ID=MMETSP0009_2-20130614/7426_1 /TAXON_ID=210454 /ORGANISM="Grammatophora oceanica, Strain CCMP 410" /LENGTH=145 /DNA_ID=CAMNT_0038676137 /DNA_START=94 /DNA_END=531 /DNA_ORIENTATION=+